MMRSPLQVPAVWYFWLALVAFIGALSLDQLHVVSAIVGDRLFAPAALQGMPVYYFQLAISALACYLSLVYFYFTQFPALNPLSTGIEDRVLFLVLSVVLVLTFINLELALALLGVDLICLSLSLGWKNQKAGIDRVWSFSLQLGLVALGIAGLYTLLALCSMAPYWFWITHPWLGGIAVFVWITSLSWLLLDRGIISPGETEKSLKATAWLVLASSLIGLVFHFIWLFSDWHYSNLPVVLCYLELAPGYWYVFNAFKKIKWSLSDDFRYWAGWCGVLIATGLLIPAISSRASVLGVGFHLHALLWPLIICGLIMLPVRHGKRLGLNYLKLSRWGYQLLKVGITLYFLSYWQVALASLWEPIELIQAPVKSWGLFWAKSLLASGMFLAVAYFLFLFVRERTKLIRIEASPTIGEAHIPRDLGNHLENNSF